MHGLGEKFLYIDWDNSDFLVRLEVDVDCVIVCVEGELGMPATTYERE